MNRWKGGMKMPKVGIVMGSDSDLKVMSKAAKQLESFGIDYEMTIISAHREPDVFFEWARAAEGKGIKVIIAGAGMAAHLPGMCAALFPMPVIGVPLSGKNLDGMDALYSRCHRGYRRRNECCDSGREDSGCIGTGASGEAERVYGGDEGCRPVQGRKAGRDWI